MTSTRTHRKHLATIDEIKNIARRQMAEQGETALSLGAIARAMGMTTPALYRYFADRDALVTALIVDAYTSFADALDATNTATTGGSPRLRLLALARTHRGWAAAHRHDYALIYGTPIPGYDAPGEITIPIASRVLLAFGLVLRDALVAGALTIPAAYRAIPQAQVQPASDIARDFYQGTDAAALVYLTYALRAELHGLVWVELYEHLAPGVGENGELYEIAINDIANRLQLA